MLLKRWEPIAELRRMDSEMDRMWRHTFHPFRPWPRFWSEFGRVAIDIYQDADNLVVKAAMPGVKPDDLDLDITDGALTIKGESKFEKDVKDEDYLHRERRYGSYRRVVALPRDLNTEKADASYDDGILTVTIPKSEETRRKPLKISVKASEDKDSQVRIRCWGG